MIAPAEVNFEVTFRRSEGDCTGNVITVGSTWLWSMNAGKFVTNGWLLLLVDGGIGECGRGGIKECDGALGLFLPNGIWDCIGPLVRPVTACCLNWRPITAAL